MIFIADMEIMAHYKRMTDTHPWTPASATGSVSAREVRANMAELLSRARYGHERILVTRHGRADAVLIGLADLERLEALEEAADVRAYDAAKAEDDGTRVAWSDIRDALGR